MTKVEISVGESGTYIGTSLNDLMEFDHVIRVQHIGRNADPQVCGGPAGVYAPEVYIELDDEGQVIDLAAGPTAEGWDLMTGYTGQDRYHGAIMHPSEYIGGRMERDILERPGLYVVCEVTGLYPSEEAAKADSDDPIGWVVAYRYECGC